MYAAIDFGTTNTDVVICSNNSGLNFYTFQTQNVNLEFIDKIFKEISIDLSKIKNIAVTGGKSSNLENTYKEIPIEKINEIDAIALGAKNLYEINEDSFVVVSTGTGTACVHSNGVTHNHLGGISVGGGTLQGLSNCILGTSTQSNIDKLSVKGKRENVDLLIGDVVNEIGSLYPEITASNFARARKIKNISKRILVEKPFSNDFDYIFGEEMQNDIKKYEDHLADQFNLKMELHNEGYEKDLAQGKKYDLTDKVHKKLQVASQAFSFPTEEEFQLDTEDCAENYIDTLINSETQKKEYKCNSCNKQYKS